MSMENLKSRTDLSLDEINQLLDNEKDVNVFKKLLYFKFKEMGFSKIKSCELAGFPESSRYYLEDMWAEGGYNSLIPHYSGGRKSKLSDKQLNDLKIKLESRDSWLVDDVKKLIKDEFNVEYEYQSVRSLLIRLNVPIANYFEIERDTKKISKNVIDNFEDISEKDKKEIKEIILKMKEEKNLFVYQKLSYLLFRKIGFSNKEASQFLNVTTVTGNNWLKAWENKGYGGLLRKKGQGRKSKLTKKQLETLKKN